MGKLKLYSVIFEIADCEPRVLQEIVVQTDIISAGLNGGGLWTSIVVVVVVVVVEVEAVIEIIQ